jgi:Spy/CpxP family protein refolding chaperone
LNAKFLLLFITAAILTSTAHAQHTPYAGQDKRAIKSLSADEVRQYLAGAGMGYARAAELHHYPGPKHALELADKLDLSPEQRDATEKLMDEHNADARAIGAKLVHAERTLDQLFASGNVSQSELAQQTRAIATLQGEFRLAHLETHRRLRPLLTPEQIKHYALLRGYAGSHDSGNPHKH